MSGVAASLPVAPSSAARLATEPHGDAGVLRVLHVVETALGGCGTYLNEIVPLQIAHLGIGNVRVVAPDRHLRQMQAIDPCVVEPFRRAGRWRGLLRLTVAVIAACRAHRPSVVHAHSTVAGLVVRLLGLVQRRRFVVVYCPHGWAFDVESAGPLRRLARGAERLLSLCCDRVVAISDAEAERARAAGIALDRISVIPNGVGASLPASSTASPTASGAAWSTGRRKVLFVGRLDRQKGLDVLLAAVRGCADRLSVRVVGEPVVGDSRVAPAEDVDVDYLGWLDPDGVCRQMQACDVLVVPSRWEGFGLVAVEAMRAGKAVIASAVGGLPEIVLDGVTGRVVPPGDPFRLRDALLGITDEELRTMGAAGRERFLGRFTSDRLCEALDDLYRSLLLARAAARPPAAATHV